MKPLTWNPLCNSICHILTHWRIILERMKCIFGKRTQVVQFSLANHIKFCSICSTVTYNDYILRLTSLANYSLRIRVSKVGYLSRVQCANFSHGLDVNEVFVAPS